MKIEVLTADWCGKCRQAKKMLKDFDISWIEVKSEDGVELLYIHDIKRIPTFIIYYDDGTFQTTRCILCVRDYLEGKVDKVKNEKTRQHKKKEDV